MKISIAVCVAVLMLAGCGGSRAMPGALSTGVQPATRSPERSLRGYWQAKLTTVVGSGLTESSLCFRFKPSGHWSSACGEGFKGTYLISGKELFASGIWFSSHVYYMSLHGSVNWKQGSGTFIITADDGAILGGGTFTMTREQNKFVAEERRYAPGKSPL